MLSSLLWQCSVHHAGRLLCPATAHHGALRDALLHALCRIALHQAAPGVAVAWRWGEARCPDAIASQITHSIDRREGHHGATVNDSSDSSEVTAHSIYT